MPEETDREAGLVYKIVVLQTKLYAARRALEAAERALTRMAEEEGNLFRFSDVLYNIRATLKMLPPE